VERDHGWKGCLRAGSRRGVQLACSGRRARSASAARARHSNAPRPAPGRDAVRQKPRQLYLACEAAILAVVTRSSTTRKAIETQRDLFLGSGMHDPRDARPGSLRTGDLKLIVRPRGPHRPLPTAPGVALALETAWCREASGCTRSSGPAKFLDGPSNCRPASACSPVRLPVRRAALSSGPVVAWVAYGVPGLEVENARGAHGLEVKTRPDCSPAN